jgi:hypothetical protein
VGKGGRCLKLTTLPPSCAVVMQSGNLNFLGPSGPFQACNGTALPLPFLPLCLSVVRTPSEGGIFLTRPDRPPDTLSVLSFLSLRRPGSGVANPLLLGPRGAFWAPMSCYRASFTFYLLRLSHFNQNLHVLKIPPKISNSKSLQQFSNSHERTDGRSDFDQCFPRMRTRPCIATLLVLVS